MLFKLMHFCDIMRSRYNEPNPKLWLGLGLVKGGAGSASPGEYSAWAPASRMNVHVAGELTIAANGSGVGAPAWEKLNVTAYGRRCESGLPRTIRAGNDEHKVTVLATFEDGTAAVSLREVGQGSVVYFAWLPGVSHLAAMQPSPGLPVPRAPDLDSDAAKWLDAAVALRRRDPKMRATAAREPPSVPSRGLGVSKWRPTL